MAWSIDTTSTCCRQNDRPNAEDASILPVWHSETTEFSVFASNRIYFEFNAPPTIHYREILSVKWGEILLNNERYVLHTMHRYSHCFRWDLGLLKFCRGINNVTQTCEQNYVKMTSMIRSLSLARQKEKKKTVNSLFVFREWFQNESISNMQMLFTRLGDFTNWFWCDTKWKNNYTFF